MKSPIMEWYIQDNSGDINPYEEYFAGSIKPKETVELKAYLWNNRFGQEQVMDAKSPKLILKFDRLEDSVFLDLCKVKVNGANASITKAASKLYVNLSDIFGKSNNGNIENNKDNYSLIEIEIGPISDGMKNNIKNLILDIDFEEVIP